MKLHPDEAAFLRTIKADPNDDTPMLVFADWLDENDQPVKAGYLRLLVEETRRDDGPEKEALRDRYLSLGQQIVFEWVKPFIYYRVEREVSRLSAKMKVSAPPPPPPPSPPPPPPPKYPVPQTSWGAPMFDERHTLRERIAWMKAEGGPSRQHMATILEQILNEQNGTGNW